MKTVAIIQARMGSTGLPGKVLLDLAGEPMLARVMQRVQRARLVDDTVVATTVQPADDAIAQLCAARLAVRPRQPGRRAGPLLPDCSGETGRLGCAHHIRLPVD